MSLLNMCAAETVKANTPNVDLLDLHQRIHSLEQRILEQDQFLGRLSLYIEQKINGHQHSHPEYQHVCE